MIYKHWTSQDIGELRRLREDVGMTFEEIGIEMERTVDSCRHKYNRTFVFVNPEEINEASDDSMRLYRLLQKGEQSMLELCYHLDMSPAEVNLAVSELRDNGFQVEEVHNKIELTKTPIKRHGIVEPVAYDEYIKIGVFSDIHAGSIYCQPTALNAYIETAREEGVRHFVFCGDAVDGVGVFRGQDEELMPECSPKYSGSPFTAIHNQVLALNEYLPQHQDTTYYMIGGNHDESAIIKYGIDPLRLFCDMRNDCKYLGYYSADVPLTERIKIRAAHPKGGVPYARSYRTQKNMESAAYEGLYDAILRDVPPDVFILALGHLHIIDFLPDPPMYGMLVPSFQGQSLFLKRLALTPKIGGVVLDIHIRSNRVDRMKFDYLDYPSREGDCDHWEVPFELAKTSTDAEPLNAIYRIK